MRTLWILLLAAAGLTLVGCDGNPPTAEPPTAEPPTGGTLVVSTSTVGDDPDRDSYLLTVDDGDSLVLGPTGTAEVDLPPGRHTLRLLGVAGHCTVVPATPFEVDVPSGSTTRVAFEISCPATGARVTVRTTGLDVDPDGYRVVVDGSDRDPIGANGEVFTGLEPGGRTITLTGLTSNCAFDGPASRTVTIAAAEVVPVEFAVVCTATSGVIGVDVTGSRSGEAFQVAVDGTPRFRVLERGGFRYLEGVPAGAHVVSLTAPSDCSVEAGSQTVTVRAGTPIRDTVEVTFSVTCLSGTIRITTPTTGSVPQGEYIVHLCTDPYCDSFPVVLRPMALNDTLLLEVAAGRYWAGFSVPSTSNCRVTEQSPPDPIQLAGGTLVTVEFRVACS